MKKAGLRTLPERKRKCSQEIHILSVDSAAHTIRAKVNGCKVTAICRENSNPDVYETVRDILIQTLLD